MNLSKIGSIEAIALIVVVMLNHIILNMPQTLIDLCGNSIPINIIFVSILAFIFLYFVIKLFKAFPNSDILDISEFLGGNIFKTIVGILFIMYFSIICGTQIRNFCEILKIVYFPKFPIYTLILIFLAIALIANKFGSHTIIKSNLIIVAIAMLNLLIAFFCASPIFTLEKIYPIFGFGAKETFFSRYD